MVLHFPDKISNRSIAQCLADSKPSFNREHNNHKEHTNQEWDDDTTFIDRVHRSFWSMMFWPKSTCFIRIFKPTWISENKSPDKVSGNDANERRQPGNSVARLLCLNRCSLH